MNLLLLGHGKTGRLVDEVARERGHNVAVLTSAENLGGTGLSADRLRGIDAVIDFTTPHAVVPNIEACARAHISLVVGTTGWYQEIPRIRELVDKSGIGFVYASNFSVGVNLFFDIARLAGAAARHGYAARIIERHHIHKKDAPSGTAVTIRQKLESGVPHPEGRLGGQKGGDATPSTDEATRVDAMAEGPGRLARDTARSAAGGRTGLRGAGVPAGHGGSTGLQAGDSSSHLQEGFSPGAVNIESIREGEIVGEHIIILESAADTITLQHSAKSRRGFAEGAVTAAEWIEDKRGFYEFHDILPQL